MDYKEIAELIRDSVRTTPSIFYINVKTEIDREQDFKVFGNFPSYIFIGDYDKIRNYLDSHKDREDEMHVEVKARNSALPMLDIENINARIEPGAIIRDKVEIGDKCVIMMGAVINIGAVVGEGTMVDMNVVIGARGTVGKNCHIGAGTVLAGVLEPPSADPVIIEDDVVIGANAVVLEGVRVGKGSVIGACAVVTKDIPADSVAVGVPARIVKDKDARTADKTKILEELR